MKGLSAMIFSIVLSLPLLANGQCDNTLPDGTLCGEGDYVQVADPESCWKYYECDSGCVTQMTCPDDEKFDIKYSWCTFPHDVECGDRPCNDAVHCPPDVTTTTKEPDCTPEDQIIDCQEYGAGYYPDEYNCRKFWHCIKGESLGEHIMCPQRSDDSKATMFDLAFGGCNFPGSTQCGGRPVCDECNENCEATPTIPPDCTPENEHIDCKDLGPGWFPDEFNCRAFWHCLSAEAEPEHLFCPHAGDDPKATMYDIAFNGCNFPGNTNCGNRPICDRCNDNCEDPEPGTEIDCGHDLDCSSKPDGWYPDPYSCPKYWHCSGGASVHLMCGPGLMYEPDKIQCDFPDRVNCGSKPPCNECEDGCP